MADMWVLQKQLFDLDLHCLVSFKFRIVIYSRTSMARTPMARLPRLFQTRSCVPRKKNPIAADIIIYGIIKGDFLCYIDNGMLCVLIKIAVRQLDPDDVFNPVSQCFRVDSTCSSLAFGSLLLKILI